MENPVLAETKAIDRLLHAFIGNSNGGNSPAAIYSAYIDWLSHAMMVPGKQAELAKNVARNMGRYAVYCSRVMAQGKPDPMITPLPQDFRFTAPEWQKFPFNMMHQGFLLYEQWWHYATTGVPGVTKRSEEMVQFGARQFVDQFSPSNFPWLNPEVIKVTKEKGGKNFVQGFKYWLDDQLRRINKESPAGTEDFKPGVNLAITPGQVIYRNQLIELIQYTPTTETVKKEPILIVPAWIMKYYILDLSPHNSMVKYLVEQGHTVFMISWLNPGGKDRELTMNDYCSMGVMAALDAISAIIPDTKIHTAGYCLGGTILSIAAAAMGRDGDNRLASMSLMAAQSDFKEAGELLLFINESQLTFLEDIMWEQGYLESNQMSGAFIMLRSKDLLWSRIISEYMKGERNGMNDLMAWNADTTRMPYRMHSQYLRSLFLNNDLAEGRFEVDGAPIFLRDIRVPVFAVGTSKDHVAPWKSVFKIHTLTSSPDITFLLTNGGHNAGIVSEPGKARRSYQIKTRLSGDKNVSPDQWLQSAEKHEGSWWPAWKEWLAQHSEGEIQAPATLGNVKAGFIPLCAAPGTYIHMK